MTDSFRVNYKANQVGFDITSFSVYIWTKIFKMALLPSAFYANMHPAMYHSHRKRLQFFEVWYYKVVNDDGISRYAIIPGVILAQNGHAFVQVLDGVRARTAYHTFPLSDFWASEKEFVCQLCRG
jgi:hypothetical protein